MQVHDLHSTRRNNTHIRALTNVIGGVGRPSFAHVVRKLLRPID